MNEKNDIRLSKAEFKVKGDICGNKLIAINGVMQHLESRMVKAGANNTDIMQFEKAFLESNGINVPPEFMKCSFASINDSSIALFIENCLVDSDGNIAGSEFYREYVKYCIVRNWQYLGKKRAFEYLTVEKLMRKSATINGRTVQNVIIGKRIEEGGQS